MPKSTSTDYRLNHLRQALGDRYRFEAFLGRGAFAAVYLAQNLHLGRREAVKVLAEVHDGDRSFADRFVEEAKLVASLDHPNIVKVYDFGETDGILWYAMQYIDGPTLRAELEERTRLDPAAVARLAIPLLDALHYSHTRGIVHRDIKPSNIILDQRGRPYVMDFGIAKSAESALKTMTGSIMGTPVYISPEQMSGEKIDGRADVYSLGIALYEMMAGAPPFVGSDMLQIMLDRLKKDPEPLTQQVPGLDPRFESIVLRSLARNRDERFADADEMRLALTEMAGRDWNEHHYTLRAEAPEQKELAAADGPASDTILLPSEAQGDSTVSKSVPGSSPGGLGLAAAILLVLALAAGWLWKSSSQQTDDISAAAEVAEPEPAETSPPPEPEMDDRTPESEAEPSSEEPADGEETSGEAPADTSIAELAPPPPPSPAPPPSPPPPPPVAEPAPPPAPVRRAVVPPRVAELATAIVLSAEDAVRCQKTSAVVSVKLDEDGQVLTTKVLQSDLPECREAAKILAKKSRFIPARAADDLPVVSTTTLRLEFEEVN